MRSFVLAAPIAALALLAVAPSAFAADRADLHRGEQLVERYCAGCHAVRQSGASPNAAAPPFRDLHTRYQIDDLAEGLAEGLLTGHPAMPEFEFSPSDVQAIIAYLKSIQTHQDAALPRASGR
ncbi:c-type cytochrome [Phenylobacterium soli]|uniref:Cytochrome c n=1 Tax=Phenylobacterium soli TaxID=2170551 RepID=A0A328ATL8_9CAUL|nr:cytochrome c [Phenylobacterium soli]RAK56278.1 cytochrome c [Phenylobacterium soli]